MVKGIAVGILACGLTCAPEVRSESGLGFLDEPNWMYQEELERFAQLVAEHEREACAKECEKYMEIFPDFGEYCKGGINGLISAAKAIRRRTA